MMQVIWMLILTVVISYHYYSSSSYTNSADISPRSVFALLISCTQPSMLNEVYGPFNG